MFTRQRGYHSAHQPVFRLRLCPYIPITREIWFEEVTAVSMGHMDDVAKLSEPKSLL